jgi:lipoyl(octanoyl) transferase
MNSTKKHIIHVDLGPAGYKPTWDLQKIIQQKLIDQKRNRPSGMSMDDDKLDDVLLLVEHPHVYTLGKSGFEEHLLRSNEELKKLGATYVKIDRGGDITYHGPGQIVGYPILDLDKHITDIHKYLRRLEEVIIRTCSDYGLDAIRIDGLTGVWINGEKICAMGVKCSRWVTMHGFALNVNTDLSFFGHIVPCGIQDKGVTSLSAQLGKEVDEQEVKKRILVHFSDIFNVNIEQHSSLPELFAD